jgi:hypothetical protein
MSKTQSQLQHRTSHRETVFVREYLRDLNGTRAAIAAGYSSKTAYVAASRMLRKVKVQVLLKQLMEERQQRLDISADRVLQSSRYLLRPRKLFNHDGSLKNIAERRRHGRGGAGIEIVTGLKSGGVAQKVSASILWSVFSVDRFLQTDKNKAPRYCGRPSPLGGLVTLTGRF